MAEAGIAEWHGKVVFTKATAANIAAMKRAGYLVKRDVKKHFTLRGTGRQYGKHTASVAGEPPAVNMGVLRASIMSCTEVKGDNVTGQVGPDIEYIAAKSGAGTDVDYGLYLELGTKKMKPRPFLRPALKRTARVVETIFREANS